MRLSLRPGRGSGGGGTHPPGYPRARAPIEPATPPHPRGRHHAWVCAAPPPPPPEKECSAWEVSGETYSCGG